MKIKDVFVDVFFLSDFHHTRRFAAVDIFDMDCVAIMSLDRQISSPKNM